MFPYYAVSEGVTDGSMQITGLDDFRMESVDYYFEDFNDGSRGLERFP